LRTEHGAVEDDVVQYVVLDLDEIRLAENDNLDWVGRVPSRILDVLDHWYNPVDIAICHRLAHEGQHDTETTNPDKFISFDPGQEVKVILT
jgi:hypothetical protein